MEHGWTVRPRKSDQRWCVENCVCHHRLRNYLCLCKRLRRSARHWSPSRACKHISVVMIRKINLCLSQTGQHYWIIRMRRQRQDSRQLLWECNTSHSYYVEGEIGNIKPTVSPHVRNPAQVNRRLVKSTEENVGMICSTLLELRSCGARNMRASCKNIRWAGKQVNVCRLSDDRRRSIMLPYDDKCNKGKGKERIEMEAMSYY